VTVERMATDLRSWASDCGLCPDVLLGRKTRFGHVYIIEAGTSGRFKVGMAVDAEKRIHDLQIGSADKLNVRLLLHVCCMRHAAGFEALLHRFFRESSIHGEWFAGIDVAVLSEAIEQASSSGYSRGHLYYRVTVKSSTGGLRQRWKSRPRQRQQQQQEQQQ
jgi:hypothetical protein